MKLTELCYQKNLKTMSILINHIILDYFKQMSILNQKNKTIDNLQKIITELGERAEGYRTQIVESGKKEKVK